MRIIASAQMLKERLIRQRDGRVPSDSPALPQKRPHRATKRGGSYPHKGEAPEANPGDPTPEWQKKHDGLIATIGMGRGPVAPMKRYQLQSAIQQHGEMFPIEVKLAIERYVQDSEYHLRIGCVDLNGSLGGFGDPGLGGLGNVSQHIRDAFHRHEWVTKNLNEIFRDCMRLLVTREELDGQKPFSLMAYGKRLWPFEKDEGRCRVAAKTVLITLGYELVMLYKSPQCPKTRFIDHETRRKENIR